MSKTKVDVYVAMYELCIHESSNMADKMPEALRLHQMQPGKAHALWNLGHMAFALDLLVNNWSLGGSSVMPGEWHAKFAPDIAGGEPITGDAANYPSWDDIVAGYQNVGKTVIEGIQQLDDSDLDGGPKGTPPDEFKDFVASLDGTLRYMASHDAYHRGQMGLLANAKV